MTLYMPPIARKKRVPERYNPDSFRVISNDAEVVHPKFPGDQFYSPPEQEQVKRGIALPNIYNRKTQVLPKDVPDYRVHRPHPNSCGFLRHNVRILNEPICSVYTGETHSEQNQWWPSRTSDEPLKVPPKTKDTIYREGFMNDGPMSAKGFTRHESNPNKDPAMGVVPVNFLRAKDGQPRLWQEKISFEHQYNSRIDPNYPIRNKRHGSFVWDQQPKNLSEKFIKEQKALDEAERITSSKPQGAKVDCIPVFQPPQIIESKTSEPTPQPETNTQPPNTIQSTPVSNTQSTKRTPAATQLYGCGDGVSDQQNTDKPCIKTNNVQNSVGEKS